MGRYDKIKVYIDNAWHTPSRIRVYKNGWKDLGLSDSFNKTTLFAHKDMNRIRATLDRVDRTVVTGQYIDGEFNVLPANGYCWCPNDRNVKRSWSFEGTIYKTSDTEKTLFYCGSKSYVQIKWLADGHIELKVLYSGSGGVKTLKSSNIVNANTWTTLRVYVNKGSYDTYIVFNGVTTKGKVTSNFLSNGAKNRVGDTGVRFKNTITIMGCDYSGNPRSVSFNASTASGSDGSQYLNVSHYEDTKTVTTYE